jgi:TRAP-type C4-dicarboxylate transport system substrate-binding protein
MIDAAPSTPYVAVASRWYTRFEYMNEYPVSNSITAMLVTKDIWDKISPKHQEIVRSISKKYYEDEKTIQAKQKANEQSIQVLKKAGIKIVAADINGEMEKYVFKAAEKARENLVGKLYSKELLQKTLSILNEYRRAHPESKVYHFE